MDNREWTMEIGPGRETLDNRQGTMDIGQGTGEIVQSPESRVHGPISMVYSPGSNVHSPGSMVYSPKSKVHVLQSMVQFLLILLLIFVQVFPSIAKEGKDKDKKVELIYGYDIKQLQHDLENDNPAVRARAAYLLGVLRVAKASGPLRGVLEDDEVAYVREKAAEALGRIADPKTVPALVEALSDTGGEVRRFVILSLGNIKDPKEKAVKPLCGVVKNYLVLEDKDDDEDENDEDKEKEHEEHCKGKKDCKEKGTKRVYQDFDVPERSNAAVSLGRICSDSPGSRCSEFAVQCLIDVLTDSDWQVRASSAGALGNMKDERAVEPLKPLLDDPNDIVKLAAEWAIINITGEPPSEKGVVTISGEGGTTIKVNPLIIVPLLSKEEFIELLRRNGLGIW